jgi:glucose/arabinose dehydrogenase
MKVRVGVLFIFLAILLVACSGKTPVPPTATATAPLMIRVATPTITPSSPYTPRSTPIIRGTGEPAIPTPTPTLTPTPTPTLMTVNTLPEPADYKWTPVLSGLDRPVDVTNAGDGSGRLFIVQQTGKILIYKNNSLLPTPFLDLTQKVDCCGERGLIGLVFHPQYIENGYFYVDYVEKVDSHLYTVIARYSVSHNDPDQADPASEMRILHIEQPYQNHKGGQLAFGPDGYLYIGMGDGGSEGDPLDNGQSLQTLLGKILRIDVDQSPPYAIPADNPFATGGGMWEIWAYGLRNPWRFSFDKLTGDLYIGDVGQDAWEEIDYLPAGTPGGANLGWSFFEGSHPYRGSPPTGETFVMPVVEYSHQVGVAVTGGYVYRGGKLPAWYGVYVYGDYGSGRVWGLLHQPDGSWQNSLMFETGLAIASFGLDESGELYLVDYSGNILVLQ